MSIVTYHYQKQNFDGIQSAARQCILYSNDRKQTVDIKSHLSLFFYILLSDNGPLGLKHVVIINTKIILVIKLVVLTV